MLKNTVLHFWSLRKEFAKYFTIGIGAFLMDVGSLYLLKEQFGLSPLWAVVINQPVIITAVFYLNKYWSFDGAAGLTHRQFMRFCSLACFNYLFSIGWMYLFHDYFGVQYILARTLNIALAVGWNFLLYKHWVYKNEKPQTPITNVQSPL